MPFTDRVVAGRRLAARLGYLRGVDVVVLGLPRGGVPVAAEVARALSAPLDVIVVRKLGVPYQPELAMGAIGEGDVRIINEAVLWVTGVGPCELAAVERHERAELNRRAHRFRGDRPRVPLTGRVAVIVDDGMATGATALAACQMVRLQGARSVIVAVPVASREAIDRLRDDHDPAADAVIYLRAPACFGGVGQWYTDFRQTTDEEVTALLAATPEAAHPS